MTIFDDIRKDREAGTPGPFEIGFRSDFSSWLSIGNPIEGQHKQGDIFLESDQLGDVDDASRIARVPQLEAIALAAEKLADSLEKDWQEASYREFQEMQGYLKEFREACK